MPAVRNVLLRGAAAGALAGLATSLFHLVATEPVLERAIALEAAGPGTVSREAQKYLGGPAGQVLFGVSLGLLFALAARVVPSQAPPWRRSLGLALGAWLVVALIPQLRYPAAPPGVGDAGTISDRTSAYVLTYALGLVVVCGGYAGLRALQRRGWSEPARQALVVALAVGVVAAGYAALPDGEGAGAAPAELVWDFRVRVLAGLTLFFAVLGAVFGLLAPDADDRQQAAAQVARR